VFAGAEGTHCDISVRNGRRRDCHATDRRVAQDFLKGEGAHAILSGEGFGHVGSLIHNCCKSAKMGELPN
jgi:hypothetical protein